MEKLEWVNPKTVPDFVEKFGGFNDYPPNWRQVSEQELFQSGRMIFPPEYQDFRQMYRNGKEITAMVEATLYFFPDGTGYAIEKDHFNRCFKYYTFAVCEHKYGKDIGKKPYEHIYVCEKCGRRLELDTSDCHSYS